VPLDSSIYDRDYFLSERCEGWETFRERGGLSPLKGNLVRMLDPGPGTRVLDAGCGRGEVLLECAARGAEVAGADYAEAAVEITRETLAGVEGADVRRADLTDLPWPDDSFDRALLGDVIEHIDRDQAPLVLAELRRVLRPGGSLLVHTSPNRLFVKVAWPVLRPILRLAGKRESVEGLDYWLKEVCERFHVNEQTIFGLRRSMKEAGFAEVRAWIDPDVLRGGEHHLTEQVAGSPLLRTSARVAATRPVRTVLGNDLYAVGFKR
jgi:ubiquinone/menaquinone biosynthesis C-methylase UbiE